MSFAGAPGAAAAPQRYFCHQCDRTVTVTASPDGEISCSICHGGFVEEYDAPNPNPRLSPNPNAFPFFAFPAPASGPFFPAPSPVAFLFPAPATSFDLRSPGDLAGLFDPDPSTTLGPPSTGPEPFNPFAFLQNHLQDLMAGGATIQLVVEGGGGGGGGPLPASLGNYFFGPGLEQLIQQLAENDPNRYGTPPASKSAVESLPDIKISQDLLASDEAQCAVCKDTFEVGAEAKQMPCKHIYHKDCILPWLALHNSCPVCRYELPTDDPDYESQARGEPTPAGQGQAATGATDSTGAGGVAVAGTAGAPGSGISLVERRFRISLPLPFRAPGPHAGASNTGDSRNDGGSGGGGSDTNSDGR